jgi:hypothetical protein
MASGREVTMITKKMVRQSNRKWRELFGRDIFGEKGMKQPVVPGGVHMIFQ